jgi:hypothetical protein
VSNVLGRALLWACFGEEASDYAPQSTVDHVQGAYQLLGTRVPNGKNPIRKLRLVISGANDEVQITELDNGGNNGQQAAQVAGGGGPVGRNDMQPIYGELRALRQ